MAQKDTAPRPRVLNNTSAIEGSGEGPNGSTRQAEACILRIQREANNPITAFSLSESQLLMRVLRKNAPLLKLAQIKCTVLVNSDAL